MIELNLSKSRTLGPVALGVISATLAIGCGSGDGSSGPMSGEQTGASRAAITSRGFTVNGCVARGVFDITSPLPIDFVGVEPSSKLQNAQMQLSTLDSSGLPTPVQQTAQQASPQLQTQVDSMRKTVSLQANQLRSLVDLSQGAGSNQGAQNASNAANAWQTGSLANDQSANTSRYATSEGNQSQESITHQNSYDGNQANQASAAGTGTNAQSAVSQSTVSALVIGQLSQLESNHMMLVVNAAATAHGSVLRLFQGMNGVVTDVQDFPIVTPSCGTGA